MSTVALCRLNPTLKYTREIRDNCHIKPVKKKWRVTSKVASSELPCPGVPMNQLALRNRPRSISERYSAKLMTQVTNYRSRTDPLWEDYHPSRMIIDANMSPLRSTLVYPVPEALYARYIFQTTTEPYLCEFGELVYDGQDAYHLWPFSHSSPFHIHHLAIFISESSLTTDPVITSGQHSHGNEAITINASPR